MRSTKLFHFLSLLAPEEQKSFGVYIRSPWFNKKEELVQFWELLRKKMLNHASRELTEEEIFSSIFPGREFNQNIIRKLRSGLLTLVVKYLSQLQFEQEKPEQDLLLLRQLNRRLENKYFLPVYKDAIKGLETHTHKGVAHFRAHFQLETERHIFQNRQVDRTSGGNLESVLENLENDYRLNRLKWAVEVLNHQKILGGPIPDLGNMEEINRISQEKNEQDLPLIRCYFEAYKMMSDSGNPVHFDLLRSNLTEFNAQLPSNELINFYGWALNYCVRKINAGELNYQRALLELYQEMMEQDLLLVEGKISPLHFKNMVMIGSKLEEFTWVESLISAHIGNFQGGNNANISEFYTGILNFFKRNFTAAARSLNKVLEDYDDVFYGLDARSYLLRIFYEEKDADGMEALCNSFRIFLHRKNELSEIHKDNYNTFIRLFRRLFHTPPMDFEKLNKLKHEIEASGRPNGSDWLIEKIEGLIAEIPKYKR